MWQTVTVQSRLSYHSTVLKGRINAVLRQQPHHPRRGAGPEAVHPQGQVPHVGGVNAVHILVRPDGQLNFPVVQVLGQGKLDQYAVNALPVV